MILYQIRCVNDHEFEAWFRSSASYDEQATAGDVECPFCGETHVAKAPMAPRIGKGALGDAPTLQGKANDGDLEHAPANMGAATATDERRAQDLAQQILRAVDKLRDHVEENFEDVGDDFAKEARKIHKGDSDERGIYGSATEDEAGEMADDGIEFLRLPTTPRRDS